MRFREAVDRAEAFMDALRLPIGIENTDDLIEDVERALNAVGD